MLICQKWLGAFEFLELHDLFVSQAWLLLTPAREEELIKLDCLLYFLKLRQSKNDDYARSLLSALRVCHQNRLKSSLPKYRYSKFWSENALSTTNDCFSMLEQVQCGNICSEPPHSILEMRM